MGFDGDDFAKLAKLSSWACLDHGHGEGEHAGSRGDANETRDVGVRRDATRVGAKRAKTNETNAETERGDRDDDEDETVDEMTKGEKIRLGRMIKSLVDQGRLEYLRSRGMEGRVVGYVEPTTSPENRLLVARASKTFKR